VIVESGKFDWATANFQSFTSLRPATMASPSTRPFGDFSYTMKARMEIMRTFGPALSPLNAWLLLQGLESLCTCAWERHCANAFAVAKFLQGDPRVAWVNYPGCRTTSIFTGKEISSEGRVRAAEFRRQGRGQSRRALHRGSAVHEPSGKHRDAKTLVIHPASTTHRQMSAADQLQAGVMPDMVRISVGIETLDDILWDIDQALHESAKS